MQIEGMGDLVCLRGTFPGRLGGGHMQGGRRREGGAEKAGADVPDLRTLADGGAAEPVKRIDKKENGQFFGTSICYTSKNVEVVTSDEFLDMIIEKGCRFAWYFHYMPVGNEAAPELMPTKEQRVYMYHRIRQSQRRRGALRAHPLFRRRHPGGLPSGRSEAASVPGVPGQPAL